jgi:hypothetical protein
LREYREKYRKDRHRFPEAESTKQFKELSSKGKLKDEDLAKLIDMWKTERGFSTEMRTLKVSKFQKQKTDNAKHTMDYGMVCTALNLDPFGGPLSCNTAVLWAYTLSFEP